MPSESESSAPAASMTPRVFCKGCGYALIGLSSNQCPECGRGFDLGNRRTFARRPPRAALWRWGRRVLTVVLLLLLAAGVGLLWLWRGWQAEQKGIAQLRMSAQRFTVRPIGPKRLRSVLGEQLGYLTDRMDTAILDSLGTAETEQSNFRSFAHIEHLVLLDCKLSNSNLSHLRGLGKLQSLCLAGLEIKTPDLAFLENLPALRWLGLGGKWVGDAGFEHLKGLKHLKVLILLDAGMTDSDLQQLEGLSSLEKLSLIGNPISEAGLQHLQELKSLRFLRIDQRLLGSSGVAKLKQAIPGLQVSEQPWDLSPVWPPGD